MRNEDSGAIPYEKSNNVEISLFQKNGRITRKTFFLRLTLCVLLWLLIHIVYVFVIEAKYDEFKKIGGGKIQKGAANVEMLYKIVTPIDYYVVPSILFVFMLIQAIKRVHDTNHSGWRLLIPFYNVLVLFFNGTNEDNDYGLLPNNRKSNPKYKRD